MTSLISKSWRGRWHLSNAPAHKLSGVLKTEPDGRLSLEIEGALGPAADGAPLGMHRIAGLLDDLESVVLEECFVTSTTEPLANHPQQTWHVREALFGVLYGEDESFGVRGADFEIVGLTTWSRGRAGELQPDKITQGATSLWADGEAVVDLVQRLRRTYPTETKATVDKPVTLRIRALSDLSRVQLHDIATRPMLALIGLATGKYGPISRRFIVVPRAEDDDELTQPLEWVTMPLSGNLDPLRDQFAFLLHDLSSSTIPLQSIYATLAELHLVVDLYVAALRESSYAELGFNLTAQASESFHEDYFDGVEAAVKKFEAFRERSLLLRKAGKK